MRREYVEGWVDALRDRGIRGADEDLALVARMEIRAREWRDVAHAMIGLSRRAVDARDEMLVECLRLAAHGLALRTDEDLLDLES